MADDLVGINAYQFGFNNPVNFNDPSGAFPTALVTAGIGALAGGIAGYHIARNKGASQNQAVLAAFGGALAGGAIGYGLGSIDYRNALGSGSRSGNLSVNTNQLLASSSNAIANVFFQLSDNQLIETRGRLYKNEATAYRKMWELATQKKYGYRGRETGAWLTDQGVLVLPNVGVKSTANIPSDETTTNYYQFGFKNGDQYVNYEGKKLFIYGSIHTHQMLDNHGRLLSYYGLSGGRAVSGDVEFAQQATLGKPIFSIGADNSLHGFVWADYDNGKMKKSTGFWNNHTKDELLRGKFKLLPTLKLFILKPSK
jgi:hypothetical protein